MKDVVKEVWRDAETGRWYWRVTETIEGSQFVDAGETDDECAALEAAHDAAEMCEETVPSEPEPFKAPKPKKAKKRKKAK